MEQNINGNGNGNALAQRPKTGMEKIRNYMLSPEIRERFTQMMGDSNAMYYLNQVLTVVANSPNLQQCTPKSILISAMRAASLRLDVDVSRGQAWIIPYKGQATFQLGYKGVYELALRTGKYRYINVVDIYEGEVLTEDRMTGNHHLSGYRTGDRVIARMLYFKLTGGFEKTFVMTVEEIAAHARQYSPSFNNPGSPWNDPVERPKMERKTVLLNGLRRWGTFNTADAEIIAQIEDASEWRERLPEENEVTPPPEPQPKTEAELMHEMGFATEPEPQEPDWEPEPDVVVDVETAPWTCQTVSQQMAMSERTSDGIRYWDLSNDQLSLRLNSILKTLEKNHLEPTERELRELKRDVIRAILEYRQPKQDQLL